MEHNYVVIKLVTNEVILTVQIDEDEDTFLIMYPLQMKTIVTDEGEAIAGVDWCPYSDDKVFNIYKQDILYIKEMNEGTIEYYKRLVDLSEIDEDEELGEDNFFITGNNTTN